MNTQRNDSQKKNWVLLSALLIALPFNTMATPSLSISQIPIKLATPTHPRIVIGVTNSGSMDGTLSGAIMTGSGSLSTGYSTLNSSSSPLNYTVPSGFTPPLQAANGSGLAPYTVSISGRLYDNGASRLNVAKAGILALLDAYMQNTDFALETYTTSGVSVYPTWVYYMSLPGASFTFSSTEIEGIRSVQNPCFNYPSASATILSNCTSLAGLYGASTLSNNQYLQIGASSDDPMINDVLYAGSQPGAFVSYTGPNPSTPYPPNFSLANYNNGSIFLSYSQTSPSIGGFGTGPTNAGYVPFSPQVFYAKRGFGYGASQSRNTGTMVVPMTSAGTTPTVSSIATAINAFVPFLNPETNSTSTPEIKASAFQSPIAGLLTTAKSYLTSLSIVGCTPQLFVILISDGLPTEDLTGKYWPPLGSVAAEGYGVTATFNGDGTVNTTNDQALTDTLSLLTSLNVASIKTYIIGLGAGVDPSVNPTAAATLTAMAIAGGTINYYPATSSTALVDGLNSILMAVQSGAMATTSAAVNSTSLSAGSMEYQSSFISSDMTYQDWTGDVIEKALDPSTGFPSGPALWSAQSLLDAQSTRLITTWNPTLLSGVGSGVPFLWGSISAAQQAALQPVDALGSSRLSYLRGSATLEKHNGGTFRNRTHLLGDIVDSKPMYVGAPLSPYFISSASYLSFALANASRPPMLYVGANDGMLHAIDATTGAEQFAFIPNGVFDNLYNLSAPLYNQSHLFFVNGSPTAGDVQFADSSWHTILVGGENAGGKSIYAIDVTNPANFTTEASVASALLWEFTDPDMGLSYSRPQIAQIDAASTSPLKFAVFFGNGYNSANNTAVLYAVNPQTGAILRKIDLCAAVVGACDPLLPEGLSSVAVGQSDGLQATAITQVYAGDLQGNLWAVDVSNSSPASWTARLLFKARDVSGTPQSITTTPLVTLNSSYPRKQGLFVMLGTGQLLTQSDLTTTQTQSIYGVWDSPASSAVLTRANLQSQTLNVVSAATSGLSQDILTDTTHPVNWNALFGWVLDLPIPGQRVITDPVLINGSFITTLNTPATNCELATSMFLDINYQTGGTFSSPQIDISGDGLINASDQYNGGNPVGIMLLGGYASAPTTVGPNSLSNITQIITLSGGQQITVINPSNTSRQASWWQIQ